MPTLSAASAPVGNRPKSISEKIAGVIDTLVNPVDYFSGARLDDAMFAENIVLFKRTSPEMMRPQGITHNYHHRFELVVPLVKSGRIHVDGTAYVLNPGQVFLIFPHQFHHYMDLRGDDMAWLFITFEYRRPQDLQPLRNSPRICGRMEQEFLCELMQKYLIKPPGPERSFRLIVGVSELIRKLFDTREANCVETRDKAGDDPKGNLLQSINAYVRANLNKPLTIADLAKHTGYSISYLRAIFHREYGFSLGSYMRDSRLSMGTAMLAKGDSENIDRIAKACGFLSVFVFSRAFKKAMGISPSAYRRMLRKVQERR